MITREIIAGAIRRYDARIEAETSRVGREWARNANATALMPREMMAQYVRAEAVARVAKKMQRWPQGFAG